MRETLQRVDDDPCVVEPRATVVAFGDMRAKGVELTQEPIERYGNVDAGFRDPSGNGWKVIQKKAH